MASPLNRIPTQDASRQLVFTGMGLQKTIERLTASICVDGASVEASSRAICSKLRADIRIAGQGRRNATDALSYLKMANDSLEGVADLLNRAAKLSQLAQLMSISDITRQDSDAEFQDILSTMADLGVNTRFNGVQVFTSKDVVVAVSDCLNITFRVGVINNLDVTTTDMLTFRKGADRLNTVANAHEVAGKIVEALEEVGRLQSNLGASREQLEAMSNTLGIQAENLAAAYNQLRESNFADEIVNLAKFQILTQFGAQAGQAVPKMRSPASPRPGKM